jgi:hypothetical protein
MNKHSLFRSCFVADAATKHRADMITHASASATVLKHVDAQQQDPPGTCGRLHGFSTTTKFAMSLSSL